MSFGNMSKFADIKTITTTKDSEGFASTSQTILASVRVYREGRHGSEKWANLAAFLKLRISLDFVPFLECW